MPVWFKRNEQDDRYSTNRFAIEAKSTVKPKQFNASRKRIVATTTASDNGGTRTLLALTGKGVELFIVVLLASLGVPLLQSWASSSCSPAWIRTLFPLCCTVASINHAPFTLVSTSAPFNYALRQCGAQILPQLTGDPRTSPNVLLQGSEYAIDGDVQSPQCWEFPGASGKLGLSLTAMLNISLISIYYDQAEGFLNAPRSMIVWGLMEAQSESWSEAQRSLHQHIPPHAKHSFPDSDKFVPLTMMEYNPHLAAQQQFFPVFCEVDGLGFPIGIIVVQILDNWGGPSTRLCQVGVHGLPVDT